MGSIPGPTPCMCSGCGQKREKEIKKKKPGLGPWGLPAATISMDSTGWFGLESTFGGGGTSSSLKSDNIPKTVAQSESFSPPLLSFVICLRLKILQSTQGFRPLWHGNTIQSLVWRLMTSALSELSAPGGQGLVPFVYCCVPSAKNMPGT